MKNARKATTPEEKAFKRGAEAMRQECLRVCGEIYAKSERMMWLPGRIMRAQNAAFEIEEAIKQVSVKPGRSP